MMPEQRWSAVRGSLRDDFALSSVLISTAKKIKKCTLCGFALLFFLFSFGTMRVNKQGG